MSFILTDGKNYVMENPMKSGEYLCTTSPIQATEFDYKPAMNLVHRKGKKYSWIRNYQVVNVNTGKKENKYNLGNGGAFIGDRDINFDETILNKIIYETESILGLAGWDIQQLETYNNLLKTTLSKYDSAESDVKHSLQKYKEENEGKKPQAHKMAKVGYLLDDIRDKHKRIKQSIDYISVMKDAITYKYDIGKIKLELSKAKHSEYKGRTEYYELALNLLK